MDYVVVRERAESRDDTVPRQGRAKKERVDLGLALLSLRAKPGSTFTLQEIALWCGCTRDAVMQMEKRALKRVANKLQFHDAGRILKELRA
jgi:DNA-directed RNA polymerase specialized sigma24 family protein